MHQTSILNLWRCTKMPWKEFGYVSTGWIDSYKNSCKLCDQMPLRIFVWNCQVFSFLEWGRASPSIFSHDHCLSFARNVVMSKSSLPICSIVTERDCYQWAFSYFSHINFNVWILAMCKMLHCKIALLPVLYLSFLGDVSLTIFIFSSAVLIFNYYPFK